MVAQNRWLPKKGSWSRETKTGCTEKYQDKNEEVVENRMD